MRTMEIERKDWPHFFDDFSISHEGDRVDMELYDPVHGDIGPGDAPTLENGPDAVLCALACNAGGRLTVLLRERGHFVHHAIDLPQRVILHEVHEGQAEALEIRDGDGRQNYLRLK